MPKSDRSSGELPSDDLLLAAIDRAERHRRNEERGVLLATIKEHLDIPHNSWTTRLLRPRLEALEATGVVEQTRRHGLNLWGLTGRGRELVDALRSAGKLGELPESPQHRHWQEARTAAGERMSEFRDDLRAALNDTTGLLADDCKPPSNAWLEAGEQLSLACDRVGSAIHCLSEWPEPDDAEADVAPPGLEGRRNARLWDRS